MNGQKADSYWGGIIKALGLVFGDIGTSPIYTLTVIVTLTKPSQENIYGIISLIVWTLIILVMVEYAWMAMSLGRKGEGGTIVLREILDIEGYLKSKGVSEKVIFYGIEDIETNNIIWKFFSAIKRQTPNFVQFNKLPAAKLQGVVTRVEM